MVGAGIPVGATIASITNGTQFVLSIAATAIGTPTLTYGGNTFTGALTLSQGTLVLNGAQALGAPAAGTPPYPNFAANGGTLKAGIDLTGASKILNPIVPASNAAIFSGANSMEFGGAVAVNLPSSRTFINNIDAGKSLILSGTVTNSAASTLTLVGNNALNGITFNNFGGASAPTLTLGGTLTRGRVLLNSTPATRRAPPLRQGMGPSHQATYT